MAMKLLKKSDSAYVQILEKIQNGFWKIEESIPGEIELAKQFNCSRGIINKALTRLANEGVVERKTKIGTRIISKTIERPSNSIGLDAVAFIYPSEEHEGIRRTVAGFQDAAREKGQRTITMTTGSDYKKEIEFIARLNEFNIKGAVIYLSIQTPEDQVYISQLLARSTFPIVLACINLPGMNLPAVIFDDFHAGYTMTKYLIAKGVRRIGFFASSRAPDACHGYQWALEEAKIAPMPELILMQQGMHADFKDPILEPQAKAKKYLEEATGIEAVVCGYDYLAIGMIKAAQELGMRVPEDLLVTGIDDFAIDQPVPLTTYRVPYEKIGRDAYSLLCDRISKRPTRLLENRLTGQLVVRSSA